MHETPIALICNGITPYRLHLHRRFARELPSLNVFTVLTHEEASGLSSAANDLSDINLVRFGEGEPSYLQPRLSRALHEWKKGGRIIEFLKREKVRAVVLISYNDAGRFRIVRWCRNHGVACFVFGDSNIRSDRSTGFRVFVKRVVLHWLIKNASGVMVCGSLGRAFFEKYGADPKRIWIVPNEPDYRRVQQLPEATIERVRQRFGLDPAHRRLLFIGRIVPDKRLELLIDAFSVIAGMRANWDLLIVGDGEVKAELQQRVPEHLRSRVIWPGYVSDPNEVAACLRASDALVLPSDYEPWGVVVNEAAAAGLALVCSNVVGAAPELVREGINGRSFSAGNLSELKQALLDVTDSRKIDQYRGASLRVLQEWCEQADPVKGFADGLYSVGLLHAR